MRKPLSMGLVTLLFLTLLVPTVMAWEMMRPARNIGVDKRTERSGTNDVASVVLCMEIDDYLRERYSYIIFEIG